MKTMFQIITDYCKQGRDLTLVTVVASSGATPRGAGAHMLVDHTGRVWGTIGGGAVEYRSQQIAQQILETGSAKEHDFSLTRDDVQNLGMICGGDVRVFFFRLSAADSSVLALAEQALNYFEQSRNLWLILDMDQEGKMGLYTKEDGFFGIDAPAWLAAETGSRPVRVSAEGRTFFVEQANSSSTVYVFGGGHVSQELVPVLSHVGFRCVVLEDRPEFAQTALFPDAQAVILGDFDHIQRYVSIGEEDYACVMTRGHSHDTVIQAQLLKTPACYIGVIGSAKKKAGVFQTLYDQGFTPADTDRITSPIGISIKAETPAEIAVSIAAQMIQHRADRKQNMA